MPRLPASPFAALRKKIQPANDVKNDGSAPPAPLSGAERFHAIYDIFVRLVLSLFFAFSGGMYVKNALTQLMAAGSSQSVTASMVDALSILAIGMYTVIIACLYAIRLPPRNKFAGWVPALTGLLGGFLTMALLYLDQRYDLPMELKLTADGLILIGNIGTVWALINLGRSFSIIPEARKVVTTGPYRFIRHPLYVFEAIAALGALIHFMSPLAMAIIFAQLGAQLGRMHYEERVLRETFPEYAEYQKRTARLIPGLY